MKMLSLQDLCIEGYPVIIRFKTERLPENWKRFCSKVLKVIQL